MTTNKQLIEAADKMADALQKLTDGLAKDGVAIDGFIAAIEAQENWSRIKFKREFERFMRKVKATA